MSVSVIRSLLFEAAEEVTLPKEPTSAAPVEAGVRMSEVDFTPPEPTTASSVAPVMPEGARGAATLTKTIMNPKAIEAIIIDLKSTVATFEKAFDGEDFTVDDAKAYINEFLRGLKGYADRISGVLTELDGGVSSELNSPEEFEPAAPSEFTSPEEAI